MKFVTEEEAVNRYLATFNEYTDALAMDPATQDPAHIERLREEMLNRKAEMLKIQGVESEFAQPWESEDS